ncbi:hypothetical protein M0802_011411 [Mischocyttarus mexicanus]|nr:hypothetical protein M0802_011411 [Mischocyttarus mexicanus]
MVDQLNDLGIWKIRMVKSSLPACRVSSGTCKDSLMLHPPANRSSSQVTRNSNSNEKGPTETNWPVSPLLYSRRTS